MEWDADTFSFYELLNSRFESSKAIVANKNASEYHEFYSNPQQIFLLSVLACAGFFRVIDYLDHPTSDWPHLSHPPSRNRRVSLLIEGSLMAKSLYPDEFGDETVDNS